MNIKKMADFIGVYLYVGYTITQGSQPGCICP